ncbi:MAG: hypothetical protein ACO308_08855 [Burkholderiaceae bacterium]
MTRISGYLISACPHCGARYRRPTYSSMNFMALQHWTDGHTEGSLMPPGEFMRYCSSCESIFHIQDIVDVDEIGVEDTFILVEEPAAPPKTILQKAWRAVTGELPPTVHRQLRPDLPPYIEYLPDGKTEDFLKAVVASPSDSRHRDLFEMQLRLRLWRQGNDWFRPDYLQARKSGAKAPPPWSVSNAQVEHLERLLELIVRPDLGRGDELLRVEMLRQLRRFEQAQDLLHAIHDDSRWNIYQQTLIDQKMSHVGLYP